MTSETVRQASPPWQQELLDRLSRQSPPSALLLCGPEGIGKRLLAMELSRRWLTGSDPTADVLFDSSNHPDFLLVEPERADGESGKAADAIKIDQIRTMLPFCAHSPVLAPGKVALVYPACLLNRSAANAFLKLLEEPPPTTTLLLVAHNPGNLPATVRSRCQLAAAAVPTPKQSKEWLSEAGIQPSDTAIQLYSRAPLKLAANWDAAALEQLVAFLSETSRTPTGEMASILASPKTKARPAEWMDCILKWVTDLTAVKFGAAPSYFAASEERLKTIAQRASHDEWLNLRESLADLNARARANLNAQLLAERALSNYSQVSGGK